MSCACMCKHKARTLQNLNAAYERGILVDTFNLEAFEREVQEEIKRKGGAVYSVCSVVVVGEIIKKRC